MAAFDPNIFLGEILNSPIFWVMAIIMVFIGLGFYLGWFGKFKRPEKYQSEDLHESLMKDLKPRMRVQGRNVKNTFLIQGYHKFGKVRKYTISKVQQHVRSDTDGTQKNRKEDKPKMKEQEADFVYFLVGGSAWLSWIPYIGKNYEPDYYVINKEFVTHDPQSKLFEIDPDVHMYPYAKIWVSDRRTQRYLTELEARRTVEFEAETNINTLKRWTYYNEPQSGRVVVMEKDTQLEQDKWDHTDQTAG